MPDRSAFYADGVVVPSRLFAEIDRLQNERDRFRMALGLLAELCPPHIMQRYRQLLPEREAAFDEDDR